MFRGIGSKKSPFDIRTFSYPVRAYPKQSGGVRYSEADIEDQGAVGICTAISLTQNARKALGMRFSADFQYLIQKKFVDKNWDEGSSIFSALKAAKGSEDENGNFVYGGLLPETEWKWTSEDDRNLNYTQYIAKLKAVPDFEISRLLQISKNYRIRAYASVPVNRDAMAKAIDDSKAGILSRYSMGQEWWTDTQGRTTWAKNIIEPLRPPKEIISGHSVTDSNYDGNSFRIANVWSSMWADKGTAYRLQKDYAPTECWAIFYAEVPPEIQSMLIQRKTALGQILDYLQKVIALITKYW